MDQESKNEVEMSSDPVMSHCPQPVISKIMEQTPNSARNSPKMTATVVKLTERIAPPPSDGVSKLVLKPVSQGARKRALIHSIPKFSQVLPNQQLTQVQKVLQERLLKKIVTSEAVESQDNNKKNVVRPRQKHGRKPHKANICRVKRTEESTSSLNERVPEANETEDSSKKVLTDLLSARPELTVTVKSSDPKMTEPNSSKNVQKSTMISSIEQQSSCLPYSLVLPPEEHDRLAPHNPLYATYVYLPSVRLFVHPLAIPSELVPDKNVL